MKTTKCRHCGSVFRNDKVEKKQRGKWTKFYCPICHNFLTEFKDWSEEK